MKVSFDTLANHSLFHAEKNNKISVSSLNKITSGLKINSAGDNASTFAISEQMRTKIRALDQSSSNVQSGNRILNTANDGITQQINILQTIRAVESILGGLIHKVHTVFQLVLCTIITGMFCITTMCDQYLGLIIPAAMYKDKYDEMGLGRNMLSRTMEDGGTLWSPLVPWSSCGAYHSSILGVPTLSYLPFCFMNLINPIFALVTSAMNKNIFWADGSRTGFTGQAIRRGSYDYLQGMRLPQ